MLHLVRELLFLQVWHWDVLLFLSRFFLCSTLPISLILFSLRWIRKQLRFFTIVSDALQLERWLLQIESLLVHAEFFLFDAVRVDQVQRTHHVCDTAAIGAPLTPDCILILSQYVVCIFGRSRVDTCWVIYVLVMLGHNAGRAINLWQFRGLLPSVLAGSFR